MQILSGGLAFFIFRAFTSAYNFLRAILFGGAAYIATGRGFSLRRKSFTQVRARARAGMRACEGGRDWDTGPWPLRPDPAGQGEKHVAVP